ncbi:MAG TPA: phosphatase PAP2 family protein [Gemmatimonadaceae bacterium]|nr:phosphatase PAP2 family protein [Gemmatimonadaceae bacterium]
MSDAREPAPAAGARMWRAGLAARTAWLLAFVIVVAGLPMLADKSVYDHVWRDRLYDQDWARLLRVMGFVPTWLVAAIALWLHERDADRPRATRRAWFLAIAPAAAGLIGELLKLLLRRERPDVLNGLYSFRPWSDQPFSTVGLAWPSSHTMVAFGAATALTLLLPRAKWVWFLLAAGCGATRVLARAHFLSDVTLGALMGWSVGWGCWFVFAKRGEMRGSGEKRDRAASGES